MNNNFFNLIFQNLKNKNLNLYLKSLLATKDPKVFNEVSKQLISQKIDLNKYPEIFKFNLKLIKQNKDDQDNFLISQYCLKFYNKNELAFLQSHFINKYNLNLLNNQLENKLKSKINTENLLKKPDLDFNSFNINDLDIKNFTSYLVLEFNKNKSEKAISNLIKLKLKVAQESSSENLEKNLNLFFAPLINMHDFSHLSHHLFKSFVDNLYHQYQDYLPEYSWVFESKLLNLNNSWYVLEPKVNMEKLEKRDKNKTLTINELTLLLNFSFWLSQYLPLDHHHAIISKQATPTILWQNNLENKLNFINNLNYFINTFKASLLSQPLIKNKQPLNIEPLILNQPNFIELNHVFAKYYAHFNKNNNNLNIFNQMISQIENKIINDHISSPKSHYHKKFKL